MTYFPSNRNKHIYVAKFMGSYLGVRLEGSESLVNLRNAEHYNHGIRQDSNWLTMLESES